MKCYMCSSGSKEYSDRTALRKHLINSHPEKGVAYKGTKCELCASTALLSSNIKGHIQRAHNEFYQKNEKFIQSDIRHPDFRGAKEVWLIFENNCFRVLTEEESEGAVGCGTCSAKIVNTEAIEGHMKRHSVWENYLKDHRQTIKPNDRGNPVPSFKIVCNVTGCASESRSISEFEKHVKLHSGQVDVSGTFRFLPGQKIVEVAEALLKMGNSSNVSLDSDNNLTSEDMQDESNKNSKNIESEDSTKRKAKNKSDSKPKRARLNKQK